MQDLSSFEDFVSMSGKTLTTDSRRVAARFGKRHSDVLRAIDNMDCSDAYRERNFAQTVEHRENPSGGAPIPSRVVEMTKDGFMFLVMGFSGKEAARVKEAFIDAFNLMLEHISTQSLSLWTQRLQLETRNANSFARASIGARFMNDRRRDLPEIRSETARLDSVMQPVLFVGVIGGAA